MFQNIIQVIQKIRCLLHRNQVGREWRPVQCVSRRVNTQRARIFVEQVFVVIVCWQSDFRWRSEFPRHGRRMTKHSSAGNDFAWPGYANQHDGLWWPYDSRVHWSPGTPAHELCTLAHHAEVRLTVNTSATEGKKQVTWQPTACVIYRHIKLCWKVTVKYKVTE